MTEWLLFSQLDFDYISESLLPGQYERSADRKLHVGKMAYDVIVVPGCETLRSSTIACLEEFASCGGDILFLGDAPRLVDAVPSEAGRKLYEKSRHIGFSRSALIPALSPYREVELRDASGSISDRLIYQLREDGENRWLFAANGRQMENPDIPKEEQISFRICGEWTVQEYDTMTGQIRSLDASCRNGMTELIFPMYEQTSLLLHLCPRPSDSKMTAAEEIAFTAMGNSEKSRNISACSDRPAASVPCAVLTALDGLRLPQPVSFHPSEPNVLLLDQAEYRFYPIGENPGAWMPKEEILRLDDACRAAAGYRGRSFYPQPWTRQKQPAAHILELCFTVHSEITVTGAMLALEEAEHSNVFLNDVQINFNPHNYGYFVDECIRTIPLPAIPAGSSRLLIRLPYAEDTSAEWCYLLGDFGVRLFGNNAVLTKKPERIAYGDYTTQGFPFYAGNMTYEVLFTAEESGTYILAAEKFRAPLLKVAIDGLNAGRIALAPYQLSLGYLEKGVHRIELTAYGNRANAFGPIHCCDEQHLYMDPGTWRTTGASYSYEYQLKRMGILAAPRIFRVK